MKHIKERTIGDAWIRTIQLIVNNGSSALYDGSDKILEDMPVVIEITQPSLKDEILGKFAKQEYLDFMMNNFGKMEPISNWGYSYAQRLYNFYGTNQIDDIIDLLSERPNAKSATINLLDPRRDTNHKPCLTSLDFKIRENTLIVTGYFRSQDIGKKMYADATELFKIGKSVSERLKVDNVSVIHLISSAHIYMNDLPGIYNILNTLGLKHNERID